MPVRNGEAHVAAAIGDLQAGMLPADELLVVDDGSADGTRRIVARAASLDPRVRLVSSKARGLVHALNLGLAEATHRWIARADADDRYPVGRLAHQRAVRAPSVVLVSGDYEVFAGGRSSGVIPSALGSPFVEMSLANPQRIPHPGVLFIRDAVLDAGGYRQEDFPAEDLALWLRLTKLGEFRGVPHTVVRWQMSRLSVSHANQARQRELTRRLVLDHLAARIGNVPDLDLLQELDRYGSVRMSTQRLVLLARDLRTICRGCKGREAFEAYATVRKEIMRNPLLCSAAFIDLARGRAVRKRFRRGL